MKKLFLSSLLFSLIIGGVSAQTITGNVGIGVIAPQPDAVLDIEASTGNRGLLVPRLVSTQIDGIFAAWNQCSPGLLVYNISEKQFYYNSSTNQTSPPVWKSFPIKKCPTNFVPVGDEYCIMSNIFSTSSYTAAAAACQGVAGNSHLCNWTEWYTACNDSTLYGTHFMTQSSGGIGEWVDDAISTTDFLVAGVTNSCQARSTANAVTDQRKYRCCFRR